MGRKDDRKLNIINAVGGGGAGGGGGGLLEGGGTWETIGVNTGTSRGTQLADGSPANTKGAYAELSAATSADAVGMLINVARTSQSNQSYAFDIALGGAGSEVDLLSNLTFKVDSRNETNFNIFVPCDVPAGSRVSARCQTTTTTAIFDISAMLLIGSSATATITDTLNFDSAASGGDEITLGSVSANVKTTYLELNASTSEAYTSVIILVNTFVGSASDAIMLMDIATGAAASETDVLSNISFSVDGSTDQSNVQIGPIPLNIAAGTRVSARLQSSSVLSSNGVRVQVLGVR